MIHFDLKKKCNTSGWHNNCGLNCLTHFIAYQLEAGFIQREFNTHPAYVNLLETFQAYYDLPQTPTWDQISQLFTHYSYRLDREIIFGPVLRKYLQRLLIENAENVWTLQGCAALSEYLNQGTIQDVALPFFESNKPHFLRWKAFFDEQKRNLGKAAVTDEEKQQARQALLDKKPPIENPTAQQLADHIGLQRRNKLEDQIQIEARAYWLNQGARHYAAIIGNLELGHLIAAEELSLLCQTLAIGLEVYTPASMSHAARHPEVAAQTYGAQNKPDYPYRSLLRVFNSGVHWEFECPIADPVAARDYVQVHNAFYLSDKPSGEFRMNAPEGVNYEYVLAQVRAPFQTSKQPLLFSENAQKTQSTVKNLEKTYTSEVLDAIKDNASMIRVLEEMKENPDLVTAINRYHFEAMVSFANSLSQPKILEGFKQLNPAQKLQLIQAYIPTKVKQLEQQGLQNEADKLSGMKRTRFTAKQ